MNEPTSGTLHDFLQAQGYLSIVLTTLNTNHFLLNGRINERAVRLLLDSGASHSCLDFHATTNILNLVASAADDRAVGVGNANLERHITLLETVELNDWTTHQFPISVVNLKYGQ